MFPNLSITSNKKSAGEELCADLGVIQKPVVEKATVNDRLAR
jgi:hypothetical protein